MISTEGKIKSKNVFYASIKLLVKAFFEDQVFKQICSIFFVYLVLVS